MVKKNLQIVKKMKVKEKIIIGNEKVKEGMIEREGERKMVEKMMKKYEMKEEKDEIKGKI